MNLIDFHVTKIRCEERNKIYLLFGKTIDEVNGEENLQLRNFLVSNGIRQTYEYWDEGGIHVGSEIFNLDEGNKPYYIGYVGQH